MANIFLTSSGQEAENAPILGMLSQFEARSAVPAVQEATISELSAHSPSADDWHMHGGLGLYQISSGQSEGAQISLNKAQYSGKSSSTDAGKQDHPDIAASSFFLEGPSFSGGAEPGPSSLSQEGGSRNSASEVIANSVLSVSPDALPSEPIPDDGIFAQQESGDLIMAHSARGPKGEGNSQLGDILSDSASSGQNTDKSSVNESEPQDSRAESDFEINSNPISGFYETEEVMSPGTDTGELSAPDDAMQSNQWYLHGGWGTNTSAVWEEYGGQGINIGIMDDGFDLNHTDLANNFDSNGTLHYDINNNNHNVMFGSGDYHGTNVAGVIGADDNGLGTVGIAHDVNMFGYQVDFSQGISPSMLANLYENYVTPNADVFNNSWGFTNSFAGNFNSGWSSLGNAIENSVDTGRGGLGTNIVFSAGNSRADGADVNHSNMTNSPYTIAVAAHHEFGDHTGFSTEGAALLVSAPGQNMLTTDNSGAAGSSSGDYHTTSGTSFSAPAVSGVIGLMLDANEGLGYRDVQEILAYSSRQINAGDTGWQTNGAQTLNGGGLHFSHDFGFGAVDAHAAVRLSESWDVQQTFDGSFDGYEGLSKVTSSGGTISLSDGGTVSDTISVSQDIELEQVTVNVDISHSQTGDLTVVLVSPDGTESYLLTRPNTYGSNGLGQDNPGSFSGSLSDWDLSSNAHWGESSQGDWELRVTDAAGNGTGTLTWDVEFLGNAQRTNDFYVYTDEFLTSSGGTSLIDSDGGIDLVNASAVTTGSVIDLSGGQSTIAGRNLTIDSSLENIYGGDGEDILSGNASGNTIYGARGNDTIYGSDGSDNLDGGLGADIVSYTQGIAEFLFTFVDAVTVTIENLAQSFTDTLRNFETYIFGGQSYTRSELEIASAELPEIAFRYTHEEGSFRGGSTSNEITNYSASELSVSALSGNLITVDRNPESYTLTLENSSMSGAMSVGATDQADTINLRGAHSDFDFTIFAGAGDDNVMIGADLTGNNRIYGMDGNDEIHGGEGTDRIYGDLVNGGEGWSGADLIYGGGAQDFLYGQGGDDTIYGEDGNDRILGGAGQDTLNGGTGIDIIKGEDGNDVINGQDGDDRLFGGEGDDVLTGGSGKDWFDGGAGIDTISYAGANGAVQIRLDHTLAKENGAIEQVENIENATGSAYNDYIVGDDFDNVLRGGAGNDRIFGGAGDDVIYGGDGVDNIYGQGGADTFVFESVTAFNNYNPIRDFNQSEGDLLDISDLLEGYDPLADAIEEFVIATDTGYGSTRVSVDSNGGADNFQAITVLDGVTNITDIAALVNNGEALT